MHWKDRRADDPLFMTLDADSDRELLSNKLKTGDFVELVHVINKGDKPVLFRVRITEVSSDDKFIGTVESFEPHESFFLLKEHEGIKLGDSVEFGFNHVHGVNKVA